MEIQGKDLSSVSICRYFSEIFCDNFDFGI